MRAPAVERRRLRRLRLVLLVVLMVVVDVAAGTTFAPSRTPEVFVDPALRFDAVSLDQPGLVEVQDDALAFRFVEHPTDPTRWTLNDATTATIGFAHRTGRRTWAPPTPAHRVAFIGGSSAFGVGQGDDDTVASHLARQLTDAGAPTRVDNFGMSAFTLDQSAADLEERMQDGYRVDVVVAFVGFNEMLLAFADLAVPATLREVPAAQVNPDRLTASPLSWSFLAQVTGLYRQTVQTPLRRYPTTGSIIVDTAETTALAASNTLAGYRRLEALARTYGFEVVLVDTPSFFDLAPDEQERHPPVTDVDVLTASLVADVAAGMRYTLAAEIEAPYLVATDAVVGDECFLDVVHTVGRCSPAIAAAVVPAVLERLASSRGG